MLQFKHPHDLKQLPDTHPAYPILKDLVERLIVDFPPHRAYAPEDDRWVVGKSSWTCSCISKALDTWPLP